MSGPPGVPRFASIERLQMSAPIVRLMNTIRPSEVTEAAASSVVPNVARCACPVTRQPSRAMATCHMFEESPTMP